MTVALGELGVGLLAHVPAALGLDLIGRDRASRTPSAAGRPVDVATRSDVLTGHGVLVLRRVNDSQELASRLDTVRSVPETVTSTVVHIGRDLANTSSGREWEAVDATERRIEVSSTTVKLRHKVVVVTVNSTDARKTLLDFVLVSESNPAGLSSSSKGSDSSKSLEEHE